MFYIKLILLSPFVLLYFIITQTRNLLFDFNLIKINKLEPYVISVGNLSMGGTGKTPFTIALIKFLRPYFKNIAIISRGYGRSSKGPHIVSIAGKILLNAEQAGDEAYLIACKFKDCTVIVAEKRFEGFKLLDKKNIDLVILDDAFQHRFLARDLNICLINAFKPLDKDFLFPVGYLREAKFNLKRADLTIVTKAKNDEISIYNALYDKKTFSKAINPDYSYCLISGIADITVLKNQLLSQNIVLEKSIKLKDHAKRNSFTFFKEEHYLITEKDAVKLELELLNFDITIVYNELIFNDALKEFILKKIKL
jgi:tetraacyldisaccharide 4'-kinase